MTRNHQQLVKESLARNKTCYIIKCNGKTIKAHSITNNRLLKKISDKGMVTGLDFKNVQSIDGDLVEIGKSAASTFKGFCGNHDKAFEPIDSHDYRLGDKKQEYLFAMRAHAKEFNARVASDEAMSLIEASFDLPKENIEILQETYKHFSKGTDDQRLHRATFNDTFIKSKYNAIDSVCLVVKGKELPIVFSSAFNLERNEEGDFINDVSNLQAKMKPTFMTVFPQNGDTYCLISYFHKDRKEYEFLKNFCSRSQAEVEVLISNLIFAYGENFFINPSFWKELSHATKQKVANIFAISMSLQFVPLVADPSLNLFKADS